MGKKVIPVVTTDHAGSSGQQLAIVRVLHVNGQIEERALDAGVYDVGRTAGDIILPGDRSVSRLHARLEVTSSGITITDLDSTSGTFDARGTRLANPVALGPNESVRIGHAVLSVVRLLGAGPNTSGVLRGARVTQPAIPAALHKGATQPAIPAAIRAGSMEPPLSDRYDPHSRDSEPVQSGSRATKPRRKSEKPPA
jgi:FHA domain